MPIESNWREIPFERVSTDLKAFEWKPYLLEGNSLVLSCLSETFIVEAGYLHFKQV